MYNFIFYVTYKDQISKGRDKQFSRYMGTILLVLEIFLQEMVLTGILKKTDERWGKLNVLLLNKGYMIAAMFLVGLGVFKFYNSNRIEQELKRERFKNTMLNRFLVFITIVTPLIIIGFLSKGNSL